MLLERFKLAKHVRNKRNDLAYFLEIALEIELLKLLIARAISTTLLVVWFAPSYP